MTDNEIIKALEWHSNDEIHCSACPYEEHSVTHYCVDMVMKDALDLINRQKKEIERLQKHLAETQSKLEDLLCEATGGMLSKHSYTSEVMTRYAHEHLLKCCDDERAEAVKEFAERLCEDRLPNDPVVIAVNVELKEMVGEE